MKITVCGSAAYIDRMVEIQKALESLGHEVRIPPVSILTAEGKSIPVQEYYLLRKADPAAESWIWDRKAVEIHRHFDKIAWSDAILVANYEKNGIPGYVGGNTFLEMGYAFALEKGIFFLDRVPEVSYKEEILAMHPVLTAGDLSMVTSEALPPKGRYLDEIR